MLERQQEVEKCLDANVMKLFLLMTGLSFFQQVPGSK